MIQLRLKWREGRCKRSVGGIALAVDCAASRNQWAIVRVTSVLVGADRLIRSAQVRIQKSTLKRSVTKLVILGLDTRKTLCIFE